MNRRSCSTTRSTGRRPPASPWKSRRPTAGYLYNVANFRAAVPVLVLVVCVIGWLVSANSWRVAGMTHFWSFTLAFIITPLVVVGIGYAAMRLHEASLRRHPGE
jgi:uncharacterized membrane protein YhdT